jgi:hypothetical protein
MKNSTLVQNFIIQIWNNRAFENLDDFLHPDFKDYGLPAIFPPNKEGTKKWIIDTSVSFDHNTVIEEQVTQGEKSIVKIRMNLKHVGVWRDIKPTGIDLHTVGYRYFKLKDGKIIEHWALIDGHALENQIKNASHGCKIAE